MSRLLIKKRPKAVKKKKEILRPLFWELPLQELNTKEWEALCDGCGLCCTNKIEDMDTGEVYQTSVACNLLDLATHQCMHYERRHAYVPECIKLTYHDLATNTWLPQTCAYKLRFNNQPLLSWHYLLSGDKEAVHQWGVSKQGSFIHEEQMLNPLEYYVTGKINSDTGI